ncbi:two-component system, sensor histidine kinase YcbA [Paenibacillus algorifonticola]|uniref:histidine kinase n=1 Tax=Paenibacillus algorifonticola TaxID=684063 RepID=A0A1I2DN22_9BACL|nr:sensor histidine kinase [Paenibacillus algorifonticola]SFE81731.1 two-component system, sensor histidine kinase YcbA [Paenibacillus algorifonticola]
MKEKWFLFMLMVISVPIAGELNFYPFHNDFRVSLGTPTFFLFLLWLRSPSPLVSGLLVGAAVTFFRTGLEVAIGPLWSWEAAFQYHYPVFFYYLTYALAFKAVRMNRYHNRPLLLGLLGVTIEIAATLAELLLRYSITEQMTSFSTWNQILLIAIFRSFFVLGFFNLVKLRQSKATEELTRKENEKMLLLISELYEESIQLKKTLHNAENIARDSYGLYQSLKNGQAVPLEELAQQALRISGQVHDIKKDNQRIYAGLSGLISHESDYMRVEALADIVLRSNKKYARSLGKKIDFSLHTEGVFPLCHVYVTLSLLNNLVVNAVEALNEPGYIRIEVKREKEAVVFTVADNGPGIAPKHREKIFMPGFTTKYDETGNPSTGIGLAYVKQETERLLGTVQVEAGSDELSTIFTIKLPVGQIGKEE